MKVKLIRMDFYPTQLFHIYNQGNNRETLFYGHHNFHYFLWKMKGHLLPFGDLVAYCLMPNHFHWLFYVRSIEITRKEYWSHLDEIEFKRRTAKGETNIWESIQSRKRKRVADPNDNITLNSAIGDLQRGYTRAFNKERGRTGSLFRQRCKAKDGWLHLEKNGGKIREVDKFKLNNDYARKCINYIHLNPEVANLVVRATDYTYSSAKDYAGLRKGTLLNLEMGRKLLK